NFASVGQIDTTGAVSASSTACAQGSAPCGINVGAVNFPAATSLIEGMQAYRVPVSAIAPPGFASDDGLIHFTQDAGYSAELERLAPGPAGTKWVGYLSDLQNYVQPPAPVQSYTTSSVNFQLAQGADGSPFPGPFNYLEVVGGRIVDATHPAVR